MTVWGESDELNLTKPGGVFWWAEIISQITTSLNKLQANISGDLPMIGTLAGQVKALQANMSGIQQPKGTVGASLPRLVANLAGFSPTSGNLASQSKSLVAQLNGAQIQTGTIATGTKRLAAQLNGEQRQQGSIGSALGRMSGQLNGAQSQVGTVAAALKPLQANISGVMQPQGSMGAAMKSLAAAMQGGQTQTGIVASALRKPVADLAGTPIQQGVLGSTLSKAVAALAGTHAQSGVLGATMPKLTSDLVGDNTSINVVYDNALAPVTGFSTTPLTGSITVAANATVLLFTLGHTGVGGTPTLAGTNMTQHGSSVGNMRVWKATGLSAGSKALSWTPGGLIYGAMWAISFTGVTTIGALQTVGPSAASAGTAMSSGSLTCTAGALVHAFGLYVGNNFGTSMSALAGGTAVGYAAHSSGVSISARRATATTTFTGTAGGNPSTYVSIGILLS